MIIVAECACGSGVFGARLGCLCNKLGLVLSKSACMLGGWFLKASGVLAFRASMKL